MSKDTEHMQQRAAPPSDPDARFDAAMRALHAQAVDRVSPPIRARLRTIRSEAAAQPHRGRRGGLLGLTLAGSGVLAGAAVFALAVGLQFGGGGPSNAVPSTPVPLVSTIATPNVQPISTDAGYDPDTAVAALDENPDLYLWLASNTDALPRTHTE